MSEDYKFEVGQKVWVNFTPKMVHGAKAFVVSDRQCIPMCGMLNETKIYLNSNTGQWVNECYLYIEEEGIDSEAIFNESLKNIERGL